MVMSIDPQSTFEVVLKRDRERPRETRPTFVVRPLTVREYLEAMDRLKPGAAELDAGESVRWVMAALTRKVQTIRNVPPGAQLQDLLTVGEAWELLLACTGAAQLEDDDRKNSASPPPSSAEGSAPPAPAAAT